MSRTLVILFAGTVVAVFLAGFVTSDSDAAGPDTVDLQLTARSIDGAVRISYTDGGWTTRCTSPRCSWRGIPRDVSVTFIAEDGATSRFHSWTGSCSAFGTSRTCTIRASAALDVTARFSPWRLWLPVFGPGEIRAEPMPGTQSGWSCGFACVDYPNGSVLRLRAAPRDRYMMIGWGGDCGNVPSNHDCLLTLRSDAVVTATFVEKPRPSDCPPGKDCGAVGTSIPFTVSIAGRGAVTAPKMKTLPELTCKSQGSFAPSGLKTCPMSRLLSEWVELTAVPLYDRPFLRWEGACTGTGKCRFYNGRTRTGPRQITAVFG
jgi:Divergent InlB B-repeat domain